MFEYYDEIYKQINLEKIFEYYGILYEEKHSKKGVNFVACCPFPNHNESNPSFSMNLESGIYNCFSKCGGGNFITFIQKMERLANYGAAVKFIQNKLGIKEATGFGKIENNLKKIESSTKRVKEVDTSDLKEYTLPQSDPAEKHLSVVKKRVSLPTIKKWNMRYCIKDDYYRGKADGRLIIPVVFENKIVTFAGRDMTGKADAWNKMRLEAKKNGISKEEMKKLSAKYGHKKIWYPFGTPMSRIFFNWDNVPKGGDVIVCEGILSCIKVANFGYNAIAALSCQLSDEKVGLLVKNFDTIYIALDNDSKEDGSNPGQEAAKKILDEKLNGGAVEVHNILLPKGKDPDDCSKEEFDNALHNSKNFFQNPLNF